MTWAGLAVALTAAGAVLAGAWLWRGGGHGRLPPEIEQSLQLHNLSPNRWLKFHEERPGDWSRQGHAGMAFDTKRGTLLIFGSDTHGEDWDNAVHEFDPRRKRWETHRPSAGPETYRVDAYGAPVAGTAAPMPWAMHTYDAIEYHPGLDALVVMSTTEHNPAARSMPGIKRQPTWIYDLSTRSWRQFGSAGDGARAFFGGSSAFDEQRGVLFAYRGGLWEMDVAAGVWRKASSASHHDMHHTMVYDTRRGKLFVFGDYRPSNQVWTYHPGATADDGRWTSRQPKGDPCPPYSSVPVAYATSQDLFVLVVDNAEPGPPPRPRATSASTYFYDPDADTYTKLPEADLPPVGMNYMMAWDRRHEVAFLVTGDRNGTVTVWALKPRK